MFQGSGYYHIGATNTNRQVAFTVTAQAGLSNCFLFLKGNNAFHPYTDAIASPTVNQQIAQHRVNAIARHLSVWANVVGVEIATVPYTNETNNAVRLIFETYVSDVLPDEADIDDTLGMADRTPKTKDGLQTLATALLTTASLDGGNTLLFEVNPALHDDTVSTAAAITTLTVARETGTMY
jgi:hypothetical protein